ncbi:MAG: hypothetical protein WBJ21_02875 [Burkholderiaceae bacterium]
MGDTSWLQNTLGDVLNKFGDYKLAELNQEKAPYVQGQTFPLSGQSGINPVWLLIGGAVLLVVMLKD